MNLIKDTAEYENDASIYRIRPRAVVVASNEQEIIDAYNKCSLEKLSITPRGSGTSIPGQAVTDGMILLYNDQTLVFSESNVICGPYIVKSELNKRLNERELSIPVDPGSYTACTIGGMVSNNSSGARTYKYGSIIKYVKSLRVFNPVMGFSDIKPVPIDSDTHPILNKIRDKILDNLKEIQEERPMTTKNSCGYRLESVIHDGIFDVPKLFVGSEGTLCIITRIELSCLRKRKTRFLAVVPCSIDEIESFVYSLETSEPSMIELVDTSIFERTKSFDFSSINKNKKRFLLIAEYEKQVDEVFSNEKIASIEPYVITEESMINKILEARNESLRKAEEIRIGRRYPVPGLEDIAFPKGRLKELILMLEETFSRHGLDYILYGHAGDVNLHARPFLDPESTSDMRLLDEMMQDCFEKTWKMKGTITAEHGDGRQRARYVSMQYKRTYSLMKEIKEMLDPNKLLNPGVKIV